MGSPCGQLLGGRKRAAGHHASWAPWKRARAGHERQWMQNGNLESASLDTKLAELEIGSAPRAAAAGRAAKRAPY